LQSVSEVSEALDAAASAGTAVSVADLDLSGLDRILEHEAGDLTCTVEAGIRLSALQAVLAEHGQMLALDPPGDPTIGACIAGDLTGPRSHRYGRMRDLVLGVTVVLGDGLVASSGGKVVKNVAGYDLGKLFCGSRGTLGVVVRASLRLHPIPETSATLVARAVSEADAREMGQAILRSTLVPSAVDVTPDRVAVLFEGGQNAVDTQIAAARALIGGRRRPGDEIWGAVRVRGRPDPKERDAASAALIERIRASFDPHGVLLRA
jgi:glycolate dehydrogenase FAD-binding subunit